MIWYVGDGGDVEIEMRYFVPKNLYVTYSNGICDDCTKYGLVL